jgi:hypothetical protein
MKCEPQPRQKTSRPASSATYGIAVAHFGHFTSTISAPQAVGHPVASLQPLPVRLQSKNELEAHLAVSLGRSAEHDEPKNLARKPVVGFFLAADVTAAVALTDAGREIPLFNYEVGFTVPAHERVDFTSQEQRTALLRSSEQHFFQNVNCDGERMSRLLAPSLSTNCHGWVFLGGRIGIKDEHVRSILHDNHYEAVERPQSGDLAIYRDEDKIVHSGIVIGQSGGVIEIESKWGPFSVFRHAADRYYHGTCHFFRSPRQGHSLTVRLTGKQPA